MLEKEKQTMPVLMTFAAQRGLEEVIHALGHNPSLINTVDLDEIAKRLCDVAMLSPSQNKPEWGWRYLRNILNGKLEASKRMTDAILRLGALLDGAPLEAVTGDNVQVFALGNVAAGAFILADSKRCANPACKVEFVPVVPWQKCHSKECAVMVRRLKRMSGGCQNAKIV